MVVSHRVSSDPAPRARAPLDLLATNVAIVTVIDDAGAHGATANAWGEPANPGVLLVTLRTGGETQTRVEAAGRFGVSVLDARHVGVAEQFARTANNRFDGIDWHAGSSGLPLLDVALAHFECDVTSAYPFGNYSVIVGAIVSASSRTNASPLIYYAGAFAAAAPLAG